MDPQSLPEPVFDSTAAHHNRPRIRPVRGFPAQQGDQTYLGIADARQISEHVVFTAPAFQAVIPHLTGEKDIDAIIAAVGHGLTRPILEQFVARLDQAGLLEGPTFQTMLDTMRRQFDQSDLLPPAASAAFADAMVQQELGETPASDAQKAELGPQKLRAAFDQWMKQVLDPAPDPSFDQLPRAIFAPHIDYWRGWMNYASVYGRLRVVDRPDRVVILGTNHFGMGTGVVGCDKGYESPLGVCRLDNAFVDTLKSNLGADNAGRLFADRFDHEREHSVELQIPWIQHIFGADDKGEYPKVFGALIHDPTANNGESFDGKGLGLDPFVTALRTTIENTSGKTLIISSVDLSHVGSSFGDDNQIVGEAPEAAAFRERVLGHDRDMLNLLAQGKTDEVLTAMTWQQNPTRWCSLGAITATMRTTQAPGIRMLQYMAATDPQGTAMVSSFAGAIF